MFKLGQLVTTKEGCTYAITSPGKPLEVMGSESPGRITVKCLWGNGSEFNLPKDRLRPMEECEVLKRGQKVVIKMGRGVESVIFQRYTDYGAVFLFPNGQEYWLDTFTIMSKGGAGIVV
jgi:DUF971 family protein